MDSLVGEAPDALERRTFFEQLSARYAELRDSDEAWKEIEGERSAENGSLNDRST